MTAVVALSLALCGCQRLHDQQMERSLARARTEATRQIDEPACKAKGGAVRQVGMLGLPSCVLPFPDAGKACQSKADCTGACFAPAGAAVGTKAAGACQVDTAAIFGCNDTVEGGVVTSGMCVD
jgi:hypothetical protein